ASSPARRRPMAQGSREEGSQVPQELAGDGRMKLTLVVLAVLIGRPALAEGPGILAPGARPELVQERGAGEGPAWHPKLRLLPAGGGAIIRRGLAGPVSVYRKGAGSNGLMFDRQGRLVICEARNRRVTRLENDGRLTILADRYDGHRFNQPNDLTLD